MTSDRALLRRLFDAAVAAAMPEVGLRAHLPPRPRGRTVVVGAGKGAAQLAQALEAAWDGPLSGVVVTRYGYGAPCARIEVLEAAHPEPDAAGLAATARLFAAVEGLTADDLVIALVCGGGSALLPAPPAGVTLADEIALNRALLASGAPISAMNVLRKHVSRIKGGRLALAAAPARVASLVVSDIPGDDPWLVASGPTIPDPAGVAEALEVVRRYRLDLPRPILDHLASGEAAAPHPGDAAFARNTTAVIASSGVSLEAAAAAAEAAGVPAAILSDAVEGEAREVARVHAAIAREIAARGRPFPRPVVLLSGGETTVTLRGDGKGGRNCEFLLSLALGIEGVGGIAALAADTDGIDGMEENAGARVDPTTLARAAALGLKVSDHLGRNDAHGFFAALDDLVVTGPTHTNVNDFRAILIV